MVVLRFNCNKRGIGGDMVTLIEKLKALTLDQFAVGDTKRSEALDLFNQLEKLARDQRSRGFIDNKDINDLMTMYAVKAQRLQNTKGVEEYFKKTSIDIYKAIIRDLERLQR